MNTYVTENEIRESVIEYLRTTLPPQGESIEKRLHFEIKKEYTIYLGRKRCRSDAALLVNKRPIILVECKCQRQASEGIRQLESYLCGSVARFGIFANSVNPHKWIYLEMSGIIPFIEIGRETFEEQVLIEYQNERHIQDKIRVRSNHIINVEAQKRATESKIRQETQRIITQAANVRATESEIQSEVEHQLRQDIIAHQDAAIHFKQELLGMRREHSDVNCKLNAEIYNLKTELRKTRRYLWTALIVSAIFILIIGLSKI